MWNVAGVLIEVPGLLDGEPAVPLLSPFDELGPSTLARSAAAALQAELRRGRIGDVDLAEVLDAPGGGKMFGVLVVEGPNGRRGFLRGGSPETPR